MKKRIFNLGDNNYLDSNVIIKKINNKERHIATYVHKFQNETECTFPHGLDLSKIFITDFYAYCVNSAGTLYFPLPCVRTHYEPDTWFEFYIDTNNIVISSGGYNRNGFTSYITIGYIMR